MSLQHARVRQPRRGQPILARFEMLERVVIDGIAEGDLQIVSGVARPPELRLGFRHHALEVLHHVGRDLEARGGFGGNRHQRGRPASQGKGAKVFRRDQRRVHQGLERHFAELHRVRRRLMRQRERGIVFPSGGQADARDKRIAIVRQGRRVEHHQPQLTTS